jgi:hypothetical protein
MNRKTLLVISLAISVSGIIALFFLKPDVSPQYLQLTGYVKHVYQKENVAFISFVPDNLTVVAFEQVSLDPGEHTLIGRLQQYEGRVEFVVEEIK